MLGRMSAAEVTEWQAYERVTGPLGAERQDVLAMMTALYVAKALGAKRVTLRDIMPQWDRQPQDWQQMQQAFMAITVAHGGALSGPSSN